MPQCKGCQQSCKKQNGEPDPSFPGQGQESDSQILVFQWRDSSNSLCILGQFFTNNVNDIVVCDDSQQLTPTVDDRDRQQIVLFDRLSDRFLIIAGKGNNEIGFHHFAKLPRGADQRRNELPRRNDASKQTIFINDVKIVDRFQLTCLASEFFERFTSGKVLA